MSRFRSDTNNISNNDSCKENNTTPGRTNWFQTLDYLDQELGDIKRWLREKEANIRPLTEDYRKIKEENRRLDHSCLSPYDPIPTTSTSIYNTQTCAHHVLNHPIIKMTHTNQLNIDRDSPLSF